MVSVSILGVIWMLLVIMLYYVFDRIVVVIMFGVCEVICGMVL